MGHTARRLLYLESPGARAVRARPRRSRRLAELLPPNRRTAALRRQARGWPAVIALAAYSDRANVPTGADALSRSLYDYFADELFERSSRRHSDA